MPRTDTRMGLFTSNEAGTNPKNGWQSAKGKAGSLKFSAPNESGQYLFKLYDQEGRTLASSTVFKVVRQASEILTPVNENPIGLQDKPTATGSPITQKHQRLIDRMPDERCGSDLILSPVKGYDIEKCVKRFDEAIILADPDPETPTNPRIVGEKTVLQYVWPGEGMSPSVFQVNRVYVNQARSLGANIIAERPDYLAFELNRHGEKIYIYVEIYNDGRNVNFISIEPESGLQ